jgi:hypothetical protein
MRARVATRRWCFATALLLSACWMVIAAEPSGGIGAGRNTAAVGAARAADVSPWPEPSPRKVERLKAELREQFDGKFEIIPIGPWIVATDLSRDDATLFAESTIARYAAAIQRQLFTKTPRTEPVKVMLFRDKASYEFWNQKLFNEKPNTPYGYYSRARNAMVMNIGTGGGTLLHEMAHAMAEADFSDIPAWLNEGIGSLFEASGRGRDGRVVGVTNWRLTGLKEDLQKGSAPKLSELLALSDNDFYGPRSGSNYAAARYLMQYLQQQGKLETFYTRIRDGKDADALTTLRFVFDNKLTVEQIEAAVYAWVKTLSLE